MTRLVETRYYSYAHMTSTVTALTVLKIYELLVVDAKPEPAVSIIECDMKVCTTWDTLSVSKYGMLCSSGGFCSPRGLQRAGAGAHERGSP